jgi:hypothetical protein
MLNRNLYFLALCMPCFVAIDAVAVPTIKRLGVSNANVTVNGTVDTNAKKTDFSNKQRTTLVRPNSTLNLKPATVNKVNIKNIDDTRLSVGKYIHNQGVTSGLIKPISSTVDPSVSSDEFIDLKDKVVLLESQIADKQPLLTAGDGIVIENDVIGLSEDIKNLPTEFSALQLKVDETVYDNDTIYDAATGERKYVSIVDIFDIGILNQ